MGLRGSASLKIKRKLLYSLVHLEPFDFSTEQLQSFHQASMDQDISHILLFLHSCGLNCKTQEKP